MRTVQEVFSLAIDSGYYRPYIGMCNATYRLLRENKITEEEYTQTKEEVGKLMSDMTYISLYSSISEEFLTHEDKEEICFKIYRNWDQRFKILEELQS